MIIWNDCTSRHDKFYHHQNYRYAFRSVLRLNTGSMVLKYRRADRILAVLMKWGKKKDKQGIEKERKKKRGILGKHAALWGVGVGWRWYQIVFTLIEVSTSIVTRTQKY